MKKVQKGMTLIEVIVAVSVFAVISLALFSSVMAMKNVILRQEEYVKLEMVSYDINAYYIRNPKTWYKDYFGKDANRNNGYLTSTFKPTTDVKEASYKIVFADNQILSISSVDGKTVFVENILLPIEKEN